MAKMTVTQIKALTQKTTPYKNAVDTGLMIRVAKNGVKTWIVTYVVDGVQHDYRLPKPFAEQSGDGFLSLADARHEASKIRALARTGIDYKKKLEQERQDEIERLAQKAREVKEAAEAQALLAIRLKEDNLTVQDLFESWLNDGVRRKDGNATLLRTFKADLLPAVGRIRVKDVSDLDFKKVLEKMVMRGVNRSAVIMYYELVLMFKWAEKRKPWRKLLIDGNPIGLVNIKSIVSRDYDIDYARIRTLPAEEIRELSSIFKQRQDEYDNATDKRSAPRPIGGTLQCGVWIMLSTLCRVGEMLMARWEHIDFEKRTWFIPKANVKDDAADLMIYLSDFALLQFQQLRELTGDSEWCFPARNTNSHVCVKSMSKQIGDRQVMFKKSKDGSPRAPMSNRTHDNSLVLSAGESGAWTAHDLRRTGATMMQSLGVMPDVIDRCQNHVLAGGKVRRHYLHYDYAKEKTDAWQLLGERLAHILTPSSNVLFLNRQA